MSNFAFQRRSDAIMSFCSLWEMEHSPSLCNTNQRLKTQPRTFSYLAHKARTYIVKICILQTFIEILKKSMYINHKFCIMVTPSHGDSCYPMNHTPSTICRVQKSLNQPTINLSHNFNLSLVVLTRLLNVRAHLDVWHVSVYFCGYVPTSRHQLFEQKPQKKSLRACDNQALLTITNPGRGFLLHMIFGVG